ncbi:ATP-binding cassette domain-containing protein [Catenulispora sp. NL8]|uniref:ATP-binding cassette domain-containing protein n=1 Tax=Catenulispora pinistramenti TaxID=2705254 RepID=A0ABS5KWL0_9ACTN|nr:ATP-binding cassette domain-containing protein [Catenulispora pinistramenti]
MTMIAAAGLAKSYGAEPNRVPALRGVDVAIPEGTFTAVTGPSGSGKSTPLHCLSGLDTVDAGTVRIGDTEITALPERALTRLRRERIGFVFQAFNLLPTLTAGENIVLPLELTGRRPDAEHFEAVVTLLGLADRLEHRPAQLSGGQAQRVAIRTEIWRPGGDDALAGAVSGNVCPGAFALLGSSRCGSRCAGRRAGFVGGWSLLGAGVCWGLEFVGRVAVGLWFSKHFTAFGHG